MLNIAILEDNIDQLENLKFLLKKYSEENSIELKIDEFNDSFKFSDGFTPVYDIIFLDIEMPGNDGLTVANKIREVDKDTILIFVTNLLKYATKGYSVNATDYLLKPVKYMDLSITLNRVMDILTTRITSFICVNTKDGLYRVNTNDIYYVEVEKHYLTYHTLNKIYVTRGSMKSVEQQMPASFAKCNSCYMVNLKYVTFLDKENVTVGPYRLGVSRRAHASFLQALNNYLNGKAL
ncbi:MAG: response regulator transcription factor [Pseudobutyrivibrio sp.]|nr:response regulator transcription factor [Pseudobutyrivibrio sp.]